MGEMSQLGTLFICIFSSVWFMICMGDILQKTFYIFYEMILLVWIFIPPPVAAYEGLYSWSLDGQQRTGFCTGDKRQTFVCQRNVYYLNGKCMQ